MELTLHLFIIILCVAVESVLMELTLHLFIVILCVIVESVLNRIFLMCKFWALFYQINFHF